MKLSIPDMSCGHCRATVEETVRRVDGDAQVSVDLEARTAEVRSGTQPATILKALEDEGYPARVIV